MTENDYWPDTKVELAESEANLRFMIGEARLAKADVVLMTPPPIRDPGNNPKITEQLASEQRYVAMQRRVAAEFGIRLFDAYAALVALRETNPALFNSFYMDPWHLTTEGHQFIAALFAAAWPRE